MDKTYFIPVEDCCSNYNIEIEFIRSLESHGLLTLQENHRYIEHEHLQQLERYISMYYDMDINMEGMEVITRLLDEMNTLHEEIRQLKNKLYQ